ncbi:hypothetical protein [Deinococcus aquaedulcis]|uniref:hypothetical protein n=1 Tax=Deinococcus aquaedulcis TaxID=2840455 RepID=UPI001C834808|nr:hypothetical protein [Deinococcus aquaedulcis]
MKLLTFGGLSVQGAAYRREKPLLLLAYLCLEGPQPRRRLASLFWPEAANPMNSLAQNLIRLRPLPGGISEEGQRVAAGLEADAQAFRTHARAGRWAEALALYSGAFLGDLPLALNPDLEEWVLETREALGAEARAAHLSRAEDCMARGERTPATTHAEQAYHTPGAPPCATEDLPRLWACVADPAHPLGVHLRREADELGLTLRPPAPHPALPPLLGRAAELATLDRLPPGELAWLSGPPGMGKTALLQALGARGWRVLPARAGLPLATLEPLSPRPLGSVEGALNLLRDPRLKVAVDDWEDTDDATRAALTLAARQRPGATLIVAARQPPAILTPYHVPLYPLSAADLQGHPGAHAATGGHPALLQAFLRGQPPERTLDARLTLLGPDARRLFLALAAQTTPDLKATRAALELGAAALAQTLDLLVREGLAAPDGTLRASSPARQLLDSAPLDTALIHLRLARASPTVAAWPHWQQARDLWEDHDQTACAQAAHWYASQELGRGYPGRAAQTLEAAPQTPEVRLLRGWALVHLGRYGEARALFESLDSSPAAQVGLASALFRSGENARAVTLAKPFCLGSTPLNAQAAFVLGLDARYREDFAQARQLFARCAHIWHLHGELLEAAQAASLAAAAACRLSAGSVQALFAPVLLAAGDHPAARGFVLINYAVELERMGELCQVPALLEQAAAVMREAGNSNGVAIALNNLGLRHHLNGDLSAAAACYRQTIELTLNTGDVRLLGLALSNLSELEADLSGFEDALAFLEQSGQDATVALIRRNASMVTPPGSHGVVTPTGAGWAVEEMT